MQRACRNLLVACLLISTGWLLAETLWACNVPVFRYALERWQSARHEVVIFHKGKLTPPQQETVDLLTRASNAETPLANLTVTVADLDDESLAPDLLQLWQQQKKPALPYLLASFPARTPAVPYWSAPLSKDNVQRLLQSPARQEVARQLLQGTSAVWVLLESGNKTRDNETARRVAGELARLEKQLKLPKLTADPEDELQSSVALKLQFSLLRLSRTDPAEQAFVQMLLHTEADLPAIADEPMTFVLFGQGRSLPACVGKGITSELLREDAAYMAGACTCQVKQQNPGFDLLFQAPWNSIVLQPVKTRELPPLTGLADFLPPDASPKKTRELPRKK